MQPVALIGKQLREKEDCMNIPYGGIVALGLGLGWDVDPWLAFIW